MGDPEDPDRPGPADVAYFTQAQAGGWGETLRGFARFAALPPGWRVLDVGTGPGLLVRLEAAAGASLAVGCDDSPDMLRRAGQLAAESPGRLAWVLAAARFLPFAGAAFDAALATNLLFLLPDPEAGLAALARVVRPGGCVAILNPTDQMGVTTAAAFMDSRGAAGFARFSFVNYGRLAEAHHRLSLAQWAAAAERAGLARIETETRAGGLIGLVKGIRREGED